MTNKCMSASNYITLIERKMSSQMSMRFHRHLANTILILPKRAAETNLAK